VRARHASYAVGLRGGAGPDGGASLRRARLGPQSPRRGAFRVRPR